jgi:hypothetical protein
MQRQEPPDSIALALIAVAGCVNTPATPSCAAAACAWPTVTASFKTTSVQQLDLLFVVDDTPAVAGVVSKLVAQYPVFAQVLESLRGDHRRSTSRSSRRRCRPPVARRPATAAPSAVWRRRTRF